MNKICEIMDSAAHYKWTWSWNIVDHMDFEKKLIHIAKTLDKELIHFTISRHCRLAGKVRRDFCGKSGVSCSSCSPCMCSLMFFTSFHDAFFSSRWPWILRVERKRLKKVNRTYLKNWTASFCLTAGLPNFLWTNTCPLNTKCSNWCKSISSPLHILSDQNSQNSQTQWFGIWGAIPTQLSP